MPSISFECFTRQNNNTEQKCCTVKGTGFTPGAEVKVNGVVTDDFAGKDGSFSETVCPPGTSDKVTVDCEGTSASHQC